MPEIDWSNVDFPQGRTDEEIEEDTFRETYGSPRSGSHSPAGGTNVAGRPKETSMQVPTGAAVGSSMGTQVQGPRGRGTGGYGGYRDPLSGEAIAEDIQATPTPQADVNAGFQGAGVAASPGAMSDALRAQINLGATTGFTASRQAAEAAHQRGLQQSQAALLSSRDINPQMAQAMQQREIARMTSEQAGIQADVASKEAQFALGTMAQAEQVQAQLGQATNHLIAQFAQEAGLTSQEINAEVAKFNAELRAQMQVEGQKLRATLRQQNIDQETAEMQVQAEMARLEAQLKHDHWAELLRDKRAGITASMGLDQFGWDIDPQTGERSRSAAGQAWDSVKDTASDVWGSFESWWEDEGKDAMLAAAGSGGPAGEESGATNKVDEFRKTYGMGKPDIAGLMTRRFPVSGKESLEGYTWDSADPPPYTPAMSLSRIDTAESDAISKAQEARDYMSNINKGVGWAQKGIQAAQGPRQARQVGAGILKGAGQDFATSKLEPYLGGAAGPAVSVASSMMTDQPGDKRSGLRKGIDAGKEIVKNVGAGALAAKATGPLAPFTQPLIKKGFDVVEENLPSWMDPLSGIGDDLEYGKGDYLAGLEALHNRIKRRG